MPRTPEQEAQDKAIWDHHLAGNDLQGLELAQAIMTELQMDDLRNKNLDFWCHTAMLQVSLALSMAHKKRSLKGAAEYLSLAASRVIASYPLAPTPEEALKRALEWENILPGESAALHALGDVVRLLRVLEDMRGTRDTSVLGNALLARLLEFAGSDEHRGQRTSQIFQLKNGTFGVAKAAYMKYMHPTSQEQKQPQMPDQKITMAAIMLGRALMENSAGPLERVKILQVSVEDFVHSSREAVHNKDVKASFALKQLLKNISQQRKNDLLRRMHVDWGKQYKANAASFELPEVVELFRIVRDGHIGLDVKNIWKVLPLR